MKKLMMALMVAAASLLGMTACAYVQMQKGVEGSGKVISRNIPVGEFEQISASRGVKVVVADRAGDIEVRADDNLIPYITVELEDGELRISVEEGIQIRSKKELVVTVPFDEHLCRLDASSAAKILVDKQMTGDRVELEASSAGAIRADVRAGRCEVDLSSSATLALQIEAGELVMESSSAADAIIQGRVQRGSFDASSAALIRASDLTVQVAEVDCSSAASVQLRCEEYLDSHATSGGTVRYEGNCQVSARSSLASIQQVG